MSTEHVTRAYELATERSMAELEAALQESSKRYACFSRIMNRTFVIVMAPLYVGALLLLPSILPEEIATRTFDYLFCAVFMLIPVALLAVLIAAMIVSAVIEDETAESKEALKLAVAIKKFAESRTPPDPSA